MINIVCDNKIPFIKGVLENFANITYCNGADISNQTIKNADALIIRTRTICNEKLLKGSKVKFIGTATIGLEHIDTEYCKNNNIFFTNVPGCNSGGVEQYIASALSYYSLKLNVDLSKKTIGIIGVGNIGSKINNFSKAIGMKVLLNDPPRAEKECDTEFVDLEFLIKNSDIITLHVPLINNGKHKTYHMVDSNFLDKCKKNVLLINSCRGEVFDTNAIINTIENNNFSGKLIIDTWENEPNINLKLLKYTLIATPHIAGYSLEGKANGTAGVINTLSEFFNLHLKKWKPKLPFINNTINIDNNIEYEDTWKYAVLKAYDIEKDSIPLKENSKLFEQLRNNYNYRREIKYYKQSNT